MKLNKTETKLLALVSTQGQHTFTHGLLRVGRRHSKVYWLGTRKGNAALSLAAKGVVSLVRTTERGQGQIIHTTTIRPA